MLLPLFSPTGSPIHGIMHHDAATLALVDLDLQQLSYAVAGDVAAEWGMMMVAGSPLFVDRAGEEWLTHHLTAGVEGQPAAAMPAGLCDILQREVQLGHAWEAAKHASAAFELMGKLPDDAHALAELARAVRGVEASAARAYASAKRVNMVLIADGRGL